MDVTQSAHSTRPPLLPHKTTGDIKGTNFPMDGEGRVYHLALKAGELANDIIIVGDPNRAAIVSEFLTPDPALPHVFPHTCNRGFTVYTGFFQGRRVSIAGTGMGFSMIDFFVREARAIVSGQMKIIRLGSCGTPQEKIAVGTLVVAKYAFGIYADHRPYSQRKLTGSNYVITDKILPDSKLHSTLRKTLSVAGVDGAFPVVEGGCASTDYFYSSQGRLDSSFPDENKNLIQQVLEKFPDTSAIEMEASYLFDLAAMNTDVAKPGEGISAATCAIVLAARKTGVFLSHDDKHRLEKLAGRACLLALLEP